MKQNITQEEFNEKLKSSDEFYDEIFNFGDNSFYFPKDIKYNIKFEDCSFTGRNFIFSDIDRSDISLYFFECVFKCAFKVTNSNLNSLLFFNTKEIEDLSLKSYSRKEFTISNFMFSYDNKSTVEVINNFEFSSYNFKTFQFENANMTNGSFLISKCNIDNNENKFQKVTFSRSNIYNFRMIESNLNGDVSFFKTNFPYHTGYFNEKAEKFPTLKNCTFSNIDFSNCNFSQTFGIFRCIFMGTSYFSNVKNIYLGDLRIMYSIFNKHSVFDLANLESLIIYDCKFSDYFSAQRTKFNRINITKTIFDKATFFDDLIIINAYSCKRHTIRTIKQQLQKAENRIDYNRFRAYELAAYYRELKFHKNFVDKSILGLTTLFTGYNYNWFRAFIVTVLTGMLFYSMLYFFEFYVALNLNNDDDFSSGAFRFFLVTDFFSPFLDRKYLNNGYSWTIFVLGKIFIAFGIYEMIQAFRKFKA